MLCDPCLPCRHSLLLLAAPLSLRQRVPGRHFRAGLAAEEDGEERIVGAHWIASPIRLTGWWYTLDLTARRFALQFRKSGRLLLACLRAQPRFLFAEFGRQRLAEILGFENLPDFDLRAAAERRALHPLGGLLQRLHLNQPEARDEIAGHRERPLADRRLLGSIFDAGAFRGRMQAFARQHDARLDHFLVELAHGSQQFRARHYAGLAVLVGLHNHHESHRRTPSVSPRPVASPPLLNKTSGVLRHRHGRAIYFTPEAVPGSGIARRYLGNIAKYGSASFSTRAYDGRALRRSK